MVDQDQNIIGHKLIPGVTPDYVISEIKKYPLLYHHWRINTQENQRYMVEALMRIPSKADCPGFIYGFREKEGYNSADTNYWIKMGRTNRATPQTRIFEWQNTDKHQYNQIFTIRTEHNNKLELIVHLVFAYARKLRQINGKKRIQWFYFGKSQKIQTAAIINILNLIMENIHQKYLYSTPKQIQNDKSIIDQLLQKVRKQYELKSLDFKIVAFGLPRTGKSTFGSLIFEDQVEVKKMEKKLKIYIHVKNTKKQWIQINQLSSLQNPLQLFITYFSNWHKLAYSYRLLPILVIKQSDIESSKMLGLIQGFNLVQKYFKPTKLILIVTHSSKTFTIQEARQMIIENRQFLNEQQLKLMTNSQFIIIQKPETSGPLVSTTNLLIIKQKIQALAEKLKSNRNELGKLQFKMEQQLEYLCHQVIEKLYVIIQSLLANKFKQRYLEYVDISLKISFIVKIREIMNNIKDKQKQSQQTIHNMFVQLAKLLELSQKQHIQLFLYCFSQISTNNNMLYTTIMTLLQDQVNEKTLEIKDKYLSRLQNTLESFKKVISIIKNKGEEQIVNLIMEIYEKRNIQDVINQLQKINSSIKTNNNQYRQKITSNIQQLMIQLQNINQIVQLGFRIDSALGKVKECIYYGLKNNQQLNPFFTEKSSLTTNKMQQIKAYQISESFFVNYAQQNSRSIQILQKKIVNYTEGRCIVNITDQFVFQAPPKSYSIRHNIIIIAKQVKIYQSINISFKGLQNKKKLKFIVVSSSYMNFTKLALPQKSPNGHAYILYYKDGSLDKLHLPKNDSMEPQIEQNLIKLYKSSIK